MIKKYLLAVLTVFVAITLMDLLLHNVLLEGLYQQYKNIWRPDMMNFMWVMYVTSILTDFVLVYIYYKLINPKSAMKGLLFGFCFGFIQGLGMGYGSYAMFPIPYVMAISWFFGVWIEYSVAGWLMGLIIKEPKA